MTNKAREPGYEKRRGIGSNVAINIVGQAAPGLVILVALPILVRLLGKDGYGFLALLIVIVGYIGIFDFGLGKAATNLIAGARGQGDESDIVGLTVSTLVLETVVGVFLAGLFCAATPLLVSRVLRPPMSAWSDMTRALWILSMAAPAATLLSGLRGILAAHGRFDLLNYGRAPVTILTYGGAAAVAASGGGRQELALTLVAVQYVALIQNFWFLVRLRPGMFRNFFRLGGKWFRIELLRYGAWLMTSDAAGPIMVYADRLMIAGGLSVAAVGLYSAPYAGVTKLSIVPISLSAILFSELSSYTALQRGKEAITLVTRSAKYLSVLFLPFVVFLAVYGNSLLRIWLGATFAEDADGLIAVLSLGVFFNAMAHIPYATLRALGRPRATAVIHILEIPIYIFALWLIIPKFGLLGVATIWSIRMAFECIVFYIQADRLLNLKFPRRFFAKLSLIFAMNLACYLIIWTLRGFGLDIPVELLCTVFVFCLVVFIEWLSVFTSAEREIVKCHVRRFLPGRSLGE